MDHSRTHLAGLALLAGILLPAGALYAQGTAFTYQGRLNDGGALASGRYDFRFRVAADPLGNTYVTSPFLTNGVAVNSGLFSAVLDFGPGLFTGSNLWLEVDVRTNGALNYTALAPLQALTPAPYAIFANTASNLSGTLANSALPANATFAGTVAAGAFSGNGTSLANVNAAALGGLGATNFWQLGGNTVAAGQSLGSLNNQAVELQAAGVRVLRLEPDSRGLGAGNLVGGYSGNSIQQPGSGGDVIAGGGVGGAPNTISSNSSGIFIGAGSSNQVGPNLNNAVIAGGAQNQVQANSGGSAIGGGQHNTAASFNVTISGGANNVVSGNAGNISGGSENLAANDHAGVGGGQGNTNSGDHAFIAGGYQNSILSGALATIGGGYQNLVLTNAYAATVAGGWTNVIGSNAYQATIGGGSHNTALGSQATIAGGNGNGATGNYSAVPGGATNLASGQYCFAAGQQAQATNDGAFVWADTQNAVFTSTNNDSFNVRAQGGMRVVTSGAGLTVDGQPVLTTGSSALGFSVQQTASGSPNIVAGSPVNYVAPGVVGATISGGGMIGILDTPESNSVTSDFGTIGGGYANLAEGPSPAATIGGGRFNLVAGNFGTVAGGEYNQATGSASAVLGGQSNVATNTYATAGGGWQNTAGGYAAVVGGGIQNYASGVAAIVPGGAYNLASGDYSFAAGQRAHATNSGAFVWADSQNSVFTSTNNDSFNVRAQGGVRLVTSGAGLTVDGQPVLTTGSSALGFTVQQTASGSPNIIAGLPVNYVAPGVTGATISGGGMTNYLNSPASNSVASDFSTIGGGYGNLVAGSSPGATIGGGSLNLVAGGYGTVAGGQDNQATGGGSAVLGGQSNLATNDYATLGGGYYNTAGGYAAVVGGGGYNSAFGQFAVVPGGAYDLASGEYSFAAGQRAQATHNGAFVWADSQNPFFYSTATNEFSIRAQNGVRIQADKGVHLEAANNPLIVRDWDVFAANAPAGKAGIGRWGLFMEPSVLTLGIPSNDVAPRYFQVAKYSTNGTPSMLMQVDQSGQVSASGGVRLNDKPLYLRTGTDVNHGLAYNGSGITNFGTGNVQVDGPVLFGFTGGALAVMNGGAHAVLTWTNGGAQVNGGFSFSSDRNIKTGFSALNSEQVLERVSALPISRWSYQTDQSAQHVGPMAQDFHAAFQLNGQDETHINIGDEAGVALAAIQGLNQKLEATRAELKRRDAENLELRQSVDELKGLVRSLSAKLERGAN